MLKKWLILISIMVFSLAIAYFIDQYYISGKGIMFLIEAFHL